MKQKQVSVLKIHLNWETNELNGYNTVFKSPWNSGSNHRTEGKVKKKRTGRLVKTR